MSLMGLEEEVLKEKRSMMATDTEEKEEQRRRWSPWMPRESSSS